MTNFSPVWIRKIVKFRQLQFFRTLLVSLLFLNPVIAGDENRMERDELILELDKITRDTLQIVKAYQTWLESIPPRPPESDADKLIVNTIFGAEARLDRIMSGIRGDKSGTGWIRLLWDELADITIAIEKTSSFQSSDELFDVEDVIKKISAHRKRVREIGLPLESRFYRVLESINKGDHSVGSPAFIRKLRTYQDVRNLLKLYYGAQHFDDYDSQTDDTDIIFRLLDEFTEERSEAYNKRMTEVVSERVDSIAKELSEYGYTFNISKKLLKIIQEWKAQKQKIEIPISEQRANLIATEHMLRTYRPWIEIVEVEKGGKTENITEHHPGFRPGSKTHAYDFNKLVNRYRNLTEDREVTIKRTAGELKQLLRKERSRMIKQNLIAYFLVLKRRAPGIQLLIKPNEGPSVLMGQYGLGIRDIEIDKYGEARISQERGGFPVFINFNNREEVLSFGDLRYLCNEDRHNKTSVIHPVESLSLLNFDAHVTPSLASIVDFSDKAKIQDIILKLSEDSQYIKRYIASNEKVKEKARSFLESTFFRQPHGTHPFRGSEHGDGLGDLFYLMSTLEILDTSTDPSKETVSEKNFIRSYHTALKNRPRTSNWTELGRRVWGESKRESVRGPKKGNVQRITGLDLAEPKNSKPKKTPVLFAIKKRKFRPTPGYVDVPFLRDTQSGLRELKLVQGGETAVDYEIVSKKAHNTIDGYLELPRPLDGEVTDIEIKDQDGVILQQGKDFILMIHHKYGSVFAKINRPGAEDSFNYSLGFKERLNGKSLRSGSFHQEVLAWNELIPIAQKAKDYAGMTVLYDRLIKHREMNPQGITISDFTKIYQKSAKYTFRKERERQDNSQGFARFSHFVRRGRICSTCDAGNQLFAYFLNRYFENNSRNIVIETRGTYLVSPLQRNLSGEDFHVYNYVFQDGKLVATVDATPENTSIFLKLKLLMGWITRLPNLLRWESPTKRIRERKKRKEKLNAVREVDSKGNLNKDDVKTRVEKRRKKTQLFLI